MGLDKDIARKVNRFHVVDAGQLEGIEEYTEWLHALLDGPCSVMESEGELVLIEIRALVERLGAIKVEIYPNEHPPPHFHVRTPNGTASFAIENCQKLEGQLRRGDEQKVRLLRQHAKPLLVEKWDQMRPTECTVGSYSARGKAYPRSSGAREMLATLARRCVADKVDQAADRHLWSLDKGGQGVQLVASRRRASQGRLSRVLSRACSIARRRAFTRSSRLLVGALTTATAAPTR